jgi:hypothetical protein
VKRGRDGSQKKATPEGYRREDQLAWKRFAKDYRSRHPQPSDQADEKRGEPITPRAALPLEYPRR